MNVFLSEDCALKLLEKPCVFNIKKDDLYELDQEAFDFLLKCSSTEGCSAAHSNFLDYCLAEGILKKRRSDRAAPFPRPEKSPVPSLRYLELQITRKCNLSCKHCYLGPPVAIELSREAIVAVLDEFQKIQGLRVLITGGEPVLHNDFSFINQILPSYAIRKIIFTNGTLIDKVDLSDLNADEIQVSIDGMEESHDALRGTGTFKRAMRCIEASLGSGIDVSVSTMVHSRNLSDFEALEKTLKAVGIKDWTVDIPCLEGNLSDNADFHLTPEKAGPFLKYGFGDGLHGGGDGHACGLHLMSVLADGTCAKCSFYEKSPLGNVTDGLNKCWANLRHLRLDELDCDCDVIDSCRGGCRYRARLMGSETGKDLYRCEYYAKISKNDS